MLRGASGDKEFVSRVNQCDSLIDVQLRALRRLDIETINRADLERFLPNLGLNNEIVDEMPASLSSYMGLGLKCWQYPNQFADYLKTISEWDIRGYLEIGSRWGGTFIVTLEILRKRISGAVGFCCDVIERSDILREYNHFSANWSYLQMSSASSDFSARVNAPVDLVFIDGDHSYEGCMNDYEFARNRGVKYIAFHDIVNERTPGVRQAWSELKRDYRHVEFTQGYSEVDGKYFGIGVLIQE